MPVQSSFPTDEFMSEAGEFMPEEDFENSLLCMLLLTYMSSSSSRWSKLGCVSSLHLNLEVCGF